MILVITKFFFNFHEYINLKSDTTFMMVPINCSFHIKILTNISQNIHLQSSEMMRENSQISSQSSSFLNPSSSSSPLNESQRMYAQSYYSRHKHFSLYDHSCNIKHQRPILPTSAEYDMMRENFFLNDDIDRSEWYSKLLSENPEIKNFIERIDPMTRASTFGRLYLPPNRMIDQQTLLSLISQHFRTLGLIDAQSSLHSEWDCLGQIPAHMMFSELTNIIQIGISRSEKFWELSMPSPSLHEDASKLLDEEISRTIGGTPFIPEDLTPLSSERFGDSKFFHIDENTKKPPEVSLNQLIWLLTTDLKDNEESNISDDVFLESNPNDNTKDEKYNDINVHTHCVSNIKSISDQIDITKIRIPKNLTNAVCLMYKSFTTSKIFFTKLRERFNVAFNEPLETRMRSIILTLKLFKAWINDQQEFIEPPVLEAARSFVSSELNKIVPNYTANIFTSKDSMINIRSTEVIDYSKAPKVDIGHCFNIWTGDFSIFDLPAIEIARQMTILSCTKYYQISRNELLDSAWTVARFKHRAPNVIAITDRFNLISSWVQTTILTEPSLQMRLLKMRFLLNVMNQLKKMQNYLDFIAIHSGFAAPSIDRLFIHRSLLPDDMQKDLDEAMEIESPLNNYKNMREIHKIILASGKPSLPLITVLLSDICMYSDNTKTFVNSLINIKKCTRMLKLIQSLEDFKKRKYRFLPIEQVQDKLSMLEIMDDDSLFELSKDVEPENASLNTLRDQS
ncbi:RasGEF domain containing protein [Tritrichomonas foetus]|uniref:RasGEF domain containing protein n=1 Tax=Tritrichomonas foetus TaxID=1144522 RepID=A0A1J4JT37_9EUKA|nr:RasGEF domain containing protein [Tritrichomonas foetus]|eukprot:OHT02235.1 RasGEF domain containing protein [Tritrichomonas foetus]